MMMLRSSSTPILGSLLPSESPNNNNLHPFASCHFSPASDGFHDCSPSLGVRRTRSDGNLRSLLLSDHHHSEDHPKCSSSRRAHPSLETIRSFSVYGSRSTVAEEEEEEEEGERNDEDVAGGFDFASGFKMSDAGVNVTALPPLFLARGLGIDRVGSGLLSAGGNYSGGGGGGGNCDVLTGNGGGEQSDVETYYKKMVEENPGSALFLRNYAEFLFQAKGDLRRAEEYYSRAILADPGDGEILSQYAKVVWELHHDEERASCYFQRAVQASPQDSHVLAAYAGFLWEIEEEEGEQGSQPHDLNVGSARSGALAGATS
ncbi:hypothetical protein Cni_G14898 [Canna indica]|uniref:Tetratricopeptide repeat-like superfamily protein n=1 Tax=Canna indica TaxID=4628 RepID=A0AAQ3QE90_9LILI|nr:hypothetical protein Cni_G14898 [Canna indica]